MRTRERIDPSQLDIKDNVVAINRVTKVVKGGKNLSFSALVVVGDGHGVVGFGIGTAKEVPSAIKKGIEAAKKNLIRVPLAGTTIPHRIVGNFGAGSVLLKPAPDGTGIIAGGAVRAVVEAAGIGNIVTKSLGSANAHNVVRATCAGLDSLKDPATRIRRFKALVAVNRTAIPQWQPARLPFTRPLYDIASILARVQVEADGSPSVPALRSAWAWIFESAELPADSPRARASALDDGPVDEERTCDKHSTQR